jgi:hypothetical protein
MITCLLAIAIATASFAQSPGDKDCKRKTQSSTVKTKKKSTAAKSQNRSTAVKTQKKSTAVKSERKLRKVVNANPQHAGYPKADVKGNFPSHYDKHTYYL